MLPYENERYFKQKFIEFKGIYKNPVCYPQIGFDPVGEAFRLPKDRKRNELDLGDFDGFCLDGLQ